MTKRLRTPYRYACLVRNREEGRGPMPDTSAGDAAAEGMAPLVRLMQKACLSVPVAIRVDHPVLFWFKDGFTHERISEVVSLRGGDNRFVLTLSKPTRQFYSIMTPIDIP